MPKYYDGILYSELFPRERKFEHFVSSAALKHKEIHTYVESKTIKKWMEQFYIPLVSDRDDIGYCIFTYPLEEFMKKIEQLREKTTYPADITMSIGYHYSQNGDDIRISMKMADQAMYKDKEEFYKEHPELKSRKL